MNLDRIGKYRIVGKIGKGAMGEVYKAQDPLLNRFLAIKTIAPALAAEPDFRRRFQREAQSAAQLNHPNIVTVFDFGEEDGLTYMAMELLEGRDLKDLIRSPTPHLGDHARDHGADLRRPRLRARQGRSSTATSSPATSTSSRTGRSRSSTSGWPPRRPPTSPGRALSWARPTTCRPSRSGARRSTPGPTCSRWARSSTSCSANHRPFEADSAHDVRFQIVEKAPEPIRKWAPEVPPALVSVVDRALAKDPSRRFADAAEMGRALATARDAIEGDTIARGPNAAAAERTLLQAADATLVQHPGPGAAYGTVRGATALTLARSPAAAGQSHLPRTVRPDPTVAGGAATQAPASAGPSRALVLGGAAVLAVAVAVGVVWLRSQAPAPGASPAAAGPDQAGIMTDVFVTNQVELARADLADRDYDSAARRAEEALKLSAGSADAREVLEQARQAQRQIEEAVVEARDAFGRRDVASASKALGRVMALAPRHPVVAELSAALKQHLRPQAEDSRRLAESARKAAEAARAMSSAGFRQGGQLVTEADALFRQQDYASAAQKYLESRNAFERAKRDADLARAVAAYPSPPARPSLGTPSGGVAAGPAAAVPTPFAAPTSTPVPSPTVAAAPAAPPTAAPLPSPSATLPAPPTPSADGADAAVRRVIAEYGRAIGSQDLALFRSLKPDLSADEEKRLREAFKVIKSQQVGITVESVSIDGDRATVRVMRQDVVNGRPMKPAPQTFRLARAGNSWFIQSIGQ